MRHGRLPQDNPASSSPLCPSSFASVLYLEFALHSFLVTPIFPLSLLFHSCFCSNLFIPQATSSLEAGRILPRLRHNCSVQRAPRVAVEALDSTSLGWLFLETRLSGSSELPSSDTAVVSAVAYVEQILQRYSQNSVESQFRSGHEKCFRSTEISHLLTWSPTLILHRNRQAWEGKRC